MPPAEQGAPARPKAEHALLALERRLGWAKTRCRGVKKSPDRACATLALVDLALWPWAGRPELPGRPPA